MTTTDILLLGATGYTGRLISAYLSSHPDRLAHKLSLTLAGRSQAKLTDLRDSLPDQTNVAVLPFASLADLPSSLDLPNTSLVINTIGPYFTHTPTLAHLCAKSSTHYLDLSGEPHHTFSLIHQHNTHLAALSTQSLIIPACGYDSIPSDLVAYLSAKALFEIGKEPAKSTTVHSVWGGVSGGTIATAFSTFSVPPNLLRLSIIPFASSPIVGPKPHPKPRLLYKLTVPGLKSYTGAFSPMSTPNTAVVQRSYGLLELCHLENPNNSKNPRFHYGPKFTYDEFLQTPNRFIALLYSSAVFTFMACLLFKPVSFFIHFSDLQLTLKRIQFRKLATFLLPAPGSGPKLAQLENGHFNATNFTFAASSTSSDNTTTYAKTTFKGKGDPGYLLTSSASLSPLHLPNLTNIQQL
jgi:short subunit dehydrogenase-like uncharacterized protein